MQAAVELNGVRIFYDLGGDGPPVLLVMGLGAPHVGWEAQLPAFRERYRAVAFDNRGCGQSGCPAGPYTIRAMAEDAIALLDALHMRKAHVVGISMGGMIAQEIAASWPKRVGALVLASTYAAPCDEVRALASGNGKAMRDPFAAMKRLVELTFSETFIAREGMRIMQLFARAAPHGPNLAGLMAQAAATQTHDTRDRLAAVKAPTLVLHGDADAFIPSREGETLARLIPNARLEMLKGGTHGVSFERPDEWNRVVLDFLAQNDGLLTSTRLAAKRA
jgi:3-oxoadipate enol-lactonase